jgi:adenosylhomocysteine nucleosidase
VLGIAVALPAELKTLTSEKIEIGSSRLLPDDILVTLSGLGAERAYRAGALLVEHGATILGSWGCASALDIRLKPGRIILPERIIAANGEAYVTDPSLHRQLYRALGAELPTSTGALVESTKVLRTPIEKQTLAERTFAMAADMESAATAKLAHEHGLPFVAVRVIADSSSTYIPETVLNALDSDGRIDLRKLLTNLILVPGDWPKIIRLGTEFRAARQTLKQAAKLAFKVLVNRDP